MSTLSTDGNLSIFNQYLEYLSSANYILCVTDIFSIIFNSLKIKIIKDQFINRSRRINHYFQLNLEITRNIWLAPSSKDVCL